MSYKLPGHSVGARFINACLQRLLVSNEHLAIDKHCLLRALIWKRSLTLWWIKQYTQLTERSEVLKTPRWRGFAIRAFFSVVSERQLRSKLTFSIQLFCIFQRSNLLLCLTNARYRWTLKEDKRLQILTGRLSYKGWLLTLPLGYLLNPSQMAIALKCCTKPCFNTKYGIFLSY